VIEEKSITDVEKDLPPQLDYELLKQLAKEQLLELIMKQASTIENLYQIR
jgi:membrane-bound lytic murein transglycosylase MltF